MFWHARPILTAYCKLLYCTLQSGYTPAEREGASSCSELNSCRFAYINFWFGLTLPPAVDILMLFSFIVIVGGHFFNVHLRSEETQATPDFEVALVQQIVRSRSFGVRKSQVPRTPACDGKVLSSCATVQWWHWGWNWRFQRCWWSMRKLRSLEKKHEVFVYRGRMFLSKPNCTKLSMNTARAQSYVMFVTEISTGNGFSSGTTSGTLTTLSRNSGITETCSNRKNGLRKSQEDFIFKCMHLKLLKLQLLVVKFPLARCLPDLHLKQRRNECF